MSAVTRMSAGRETGLPPLARRALSQRRQQLLDRADGRVLDLAIFGPDVAGALVQRADAGERVDVVVSVLQLAAVPSLGATVEDLHRLLAPAGRLLFLEPVGRPGWAGRLQAATSPLVRLAAGHHVDRDVPAALRAGGFTLLDLERFSMPTLVWPLRPFVQGTARPRL